MNFSIKNFIRNFSYTFIANFLSMIVSIILVLIVPRYISLEDYGYWQLYLFYVTYISYMSLGLTDGAYLRYGGYNYEDLNKSVFISQFWFLVIFDLIINLIIAISFSIFSTDINKTFIVIWTCLTGLLIVPRSLLSFMLQATNRIKEFSILIIIERLIYFLLVILFLFIGIRKFEYLIFADIIGKFSSLIYSILVCKDLVIGRFATIKYSVKEIIENIRVGSKLLFANLANILVVGIVRVSVEHNWGVTTFGKVSLSLSISNMLMTFINAVGLILFPTLRRTSRSNLPLIYKLMRIFIIIPLLGVLLFYYPARLLLSIWLPQYSDSFVYMALLFPLAIYESKTLLLTNTYLKTIREEKMMLIINLVTVGLSIVLTSLSVFWLNNLNLSILSITILLAIRSIISELYLSKLLKLNLNKEILLETIMTIVFILLNWHIDNILALILYLIAYVGYLVINKKNIIYLKNNYKSFLNNK